MKKTCLLTKVVVTRDPRPQTYHPGQNGVKPSFNRSDPLSVPRYDAVGTFGSRTMYC